MEHVMSVDESDVRMADPWGAHASAYDRVFAPLTGYVARSMVAMVEARLPDDARILDVACGSGACLWPLFERAEVKRAKGGTDFTVGCDFSPGMVEITRRKASRLAGREAFSVEVQDGQALTYEDASFDAVFSCFGIFLFEDRVAGWREAARVLKPEGHFATTTWMAPEQNEMFYAQFVPIMESLPKRLVDTMQPNGWMEVADARKLEREVMAAGFVEVEVHPFRATFVLPSIETAWHMLLDNPSGGALVRQCNEEEVRSVKQHFFQSLRERVSGDTHPIQLEACCNVLTATKLKDGAL